MEKIIQIDRDRLYEKYMDWVNQVSEDCEWKTFFGAEEIVNKISDILEEDSQMIHQFPDKIVREVVAKYKKRSDTGISKYGTTLEENNKDNFLYHLQEELMDATLYVQKLISKIPKQND